MRIAQYPAGSLQGFPLQLERNGRQSRSVSRCRMAPRGCGGPRGHPPPRGERGSGDKNAKRMCRFGSGEVRRLDFLLRGPEGSTVKPSQCLDSTPVERRLQCPRRSPWRASRSLRRFRGASHPYGGSQPTRERVEFAPDVAARWPRALRRLRSRQVRLSTVSTPRWGVIPGPNDQPEPPPRARTPNLPGEFVSEELRADCVRFLEAMHALAVRRGEMLGAKTGGWVPRAHKAR